MEIKVSIEEIKKLITEKGYFKYKRQCKNEGDKSIQEHYNIKSAIVDAIFSDDRLKGIRRSTKVENLVVFVEDLDVENKAQDTTQDVEKTDEVEESTEKVLSEEIYDQDVNKGEESFIISDFDE